MRALFPLSLAIAACATAAFGQTSEPSPDPAAPDALADMIALDRDRYERLTVPVTVDGAGPFRFFIDTGAQATVVTDRVTDALGLQAKGAATLVAMGSSRIVQTVDIDGLEFAQRSFSGLTAPLLKRAHLGADGIIGLDSLQDLRVLIDFTDDRMAVEDAHAREDGETYDIIVRARRRLGQMIITDARIDGVKVAVIVDTGAQNSVGNAALYHRLRGRKKGRLASKGAVPDRLPTSVHGKGSEISSTDVNGVIVQSQVYTAREMKIGPLRLTEVPLGFHESPAFTALGLDERPALILGMGNLRVFDRVAIDFSTRQVMFDLPDQKRTRGFMDFGARATRIRS